MAMSVHEGKLHGRGRKIGKPQPRKTCPVCCKLFDFVSVEREKAEIKAEPCEECGKLLKEGWIAFTSGDKYAFCRSERMKDLGGKIVPLSPGVFQKIEDAFPMEWKTRVKHNGTPEA